MKFLEVEPGCETTLVDKESLPRQVHLFDEKSISAINAALAARRPLLIRGEPGTGKSQLARAAAKELKRAYVSYVVDARTEAHDLLWEFDAVARLAEAQLSGALQDKDIKKVREELAVTNFIKPGPLWWAFDWYNAEQQAKKAKISAPPQYDGGESKNGVVVLIDEIDKAESDVPNGLLEALGIAEFTPQGSTKPVTVGNVAPLIIITSNEERALPDAFVRRCLVFNIELPKPGEELVQWLMTRGRAHFKVKDVSDTILEEAARLLVEDRKAAIEQNLFPKPGQAEYLDLVRAVQALGKDEAAQSGLLKDVGRFTLNKHQGTK